MKDNKGEAKTIILPFQRFQGLKFYPMNQNPFLYLTDVLSVIFLAEKINTALRNRIKPPPKWLNSNTRYVGDTKITKTIFSGEKE